MLNDVADISIFESIQNQANQSMGFALSIFNDTVIENAIEKYNTILDDPTKY
jgi:hypothetical protein